MIRSSLFRLGLMAVALTAWRADAAVIQLDIPGLEAAINPPEGTSLREAAYKPLDKRFANRLTFPGYKGEALAPQGGYWPERAQRLGVSGAAVIECAVASSGALSACKAIFETPADFGFKESSLLMAKDGYLSASPAPEAKDGEIGRLLIAFKNPAGGSAKPPK